MIISRKTLVIGASENHTRYSNMAIKKLSDNNHPVIAVGKQSGKVGNVTINTEIDTNECIDTISLYLSPQNQIHYFDIIAQIKPRRIIFNPGTENKELERLAAVNNIEVVHGCTLVMLSTNQY